MSDPSRHDEPDTSPDPNTLKAIARTLQRARRVLFITGAGISADSGLPTYRGVGGLYEGRMAEEGIPIEVALSGAMWQQRPELTWRHILEIERACRHAQPNAAHHFITRLCATHACWVLTQNVDGLHDAAHNPNVIAMHGDVHELRCTRCDWQERVPDYSALPDDAPPRCPACQALIKPAVVLFGEALPEGALLEYEEQLRRGFDMIFSIGTTSAFPYIAHPVRDAARRHIPTVEINPGSSEVSHLVTHRLRTNAVSAIQAIESFL